MEVQVVHREIKQSEIGVHVQDPGGVCISLGEDQPWSHISWECAKTLLETLGMLNDICSLDERGDDE